MSRLSAGVGCSGRSKSDAFDFGVRRDVAAFRRIDGRIAARIILRRPRRQARHVVNSGAVSIAGSDLVSTTALWSPDSGLARIGARPAAVSPLGGPAERGLDALRRTRRS